LHYLFSVVVLQPCRASTRATSSPYGTFAPPCPHLPAFSFQEEGTAHTISPVPQTAGTLPCTYHQLQFWDMNRPPFGYRVPFLLPHKHAGVVTPTRTVPVPHLPNVAGRSTLAYPRRAARRYPPPVAGRFRSTWFASSLLYRHISRRAAQAFKVLRRLLLPLDHGRQATFALYAARSPRRTVDAAMPCAAFRRTPPPPAMSVVGLACLATPSPGHVRTCMAGGHTTLTTPGVTGLLLHFDYAFRARHPPHANARTRCPLRRLYRARTGLDVRHWRLASYFVPAFALEGCGAAPPPHLRGNLCLAWRSTIPGRRHMVGRRHNFHHTTPHRAWRALRPSRRSRCSLHTWDGTVSSGSW